VRRRLRRAWLALQEQLTKLSDSDEVLASTLNDLHRWAESLMGLAAPDP
jgi:hypothetical protein